MSTVFTVTELNRYTGELLSADPVLSSVRVSGEISGCKKYPSGHIYFTLKDKDSQVSCVAFKGNASRFSFEPENGISVILTARASLYDRDGRFQLVVYDMERSGIGDLFAAFERKKQQLSDEGLFAPEHKKRIPFLPRRIGIVTSPKGAVISDILQILSRRYPNFNVLIYPSAVQGITAAKTLSDGVLWFNRKKNVDVIIIARGGGSMEDLFCFNDEHLARTIYVSQIPIISAVGHETDFTICDFVSDLRAPTPSAAAELVMPLKEDLSRSVDELSNRLARILSLRIERERRRLINYTTSPSLLRPLHLVEMSSQRLDMLLYRMQQALARRLDANTSILTNRIGKLHALSPLRILSRGYGVTTKEGETEPIASVRRVQVGDRIRILLSDGEVHCTADRIDHREEANRE